ncbi:MAG: sugar phosphate nucleotidyltransferase [Candidatus Heteroscillospira sp.]|jgi:mannose-1-phosphate guanylyltransferase/phosphomannomutase
MKAIVLAGGEGQRLRPVSHGSPKPMVRLMGRPLLEHIILLLKKHGFTDICITLCSQPEVIRSYFGDGSSLGVNICYSQESRPLGTAGGVKLCEDFVGEDDVLVLSGDAACDFDLAALMREHQGSRAAATMALAENDNPLRYGLVLVNSGDQVVGFIEKPDWSRVVTDLVNTGIYVLSPLAIGLIHHGEKYDFAQDLFPKMLDMGVPLHGKLMEGYWCDVGTPADFLRCSMDALHGKLNLSAVGDHIAPGIHCASKLPENVHLHPPCYIAPGALISEDAEIGPEAVVSPGSIIGMGAKIRSSVLDGGEAGAHSLIEGAIVCRGARVKPGQHIVPGTVVAPPNAKKAPDRKPLAHRQGEHGQPVGEIACHNRAHLMRLFSEALMEAGADFSDGLVLERSGGKVRLSPSGKKSAIVIESLTGTGADRDLAKRCRAMAEEWEEVE